MMTTNKRGFFGWVAHATRVVDIGDGAWGRVAASGLVIGLLATLLNLDTVVSYTAKVAIAAPLIANVPPWPADKLSHVMNWNFIGVQIVKAAILQLATDFGLLFFAAFRRENNPLMATVAIVLWIISCFYTIETKHAAEEAFAAARIVQLQQEADARALATAPADVVQAKAVLAQYSKTNPPPAPQAESQAAISISQTSIGDLQEERAEKVAARAAETETGRRERYDQYDTDITTIDGKLEKERAAVRTATAALARRETFDTAMVTASGWDNRRVMITQSTEGYDDAVLQWLRVWGPAIASIIGILLYFQADKKAEDRRRGYGYGEFAPVGEAAPWGARGLPAPDGQAEGVHGTADLRTPTVIDKPGTLHPDAAARRAGQ